MTTPTQDAAALADELETVRLLVREHIGPTMDGVVKRSIAALRAPSRGVETETVAWCCFHCGETFTDHDAAKDHFGPDEEWQAGCIDPLTKDEKERRADQVAMYQELDRERDENSRLTNRDYVLGCFEADLVKLFNGSKSVTQAYLVLDEMEGRALAAEEKLAVASPASQPADASVTPPAASPSTGEDVLADLVNRFSAALLEKLRASEKKYGHNNGWARDDWKAECQRHLNEHLAKGDPRDVAAYCAFLWHHGWPTCSTGEDVRGALAERHIITGARAIATSRGHDPDEPAPLTEMCTEDNAPVPWWMVFVEEAEACLKAVHLAAPVRAAAEPGEMRDAIIDAVRDDLHRRSQLGIKKYGTTLADNPADIGARLQHAYEEALDLSNYLKWAMTALNDGKVSK